MNGITPPQPILNTSDSPSSPSRMAQIETTARDLEASFLAEMLKHSGFGQARSGFGGGPGEAAFSDFLVHQYADEMAANGGIGLAEVIVNALVQREGTKDDN